MKLPLRWLSEFIDLPVTDPEVLADVLAMLGHDVEGYEKLAVEWSSVVVGRVETIEAHPEADKVRICQVDLGDHSERIICGAWNFGEGAVVPVALPGAVLPGGVEIGRREIRGVTSSGMICSERELGLGEDHAGILVLDGSPKIGSDFSDLVELPDVVFDLGITPNRPDAMSMVGIARDLAAKFDIAHRVPPVSVETVPGRTGVAVRIDDPVGCRRFTATEIRGVTIGRSPLWLRHRLAKAGVRSISNVVDVSNYVMLELGHPLHAFDVDRIEGGILRVGRAASGETLQTLDGEIRELDPDDLIIYDESGPTSMSGTMGGARSEVSAETVNVLMEAASWDPPTILHMSRRHDLRSEASMRFERGVDPNLSPEASRRAAAMVAQVAGGQVLAGGVDEVATPIDPVVVGLRLHEVERILGPGFTAKMVASVMTRLGFEVSGEDPLQVRVPTFRPDLVRPVDLVEEVARIHGYDQFGATVPTGSAGGLTPSQRRERKLLAVMAGAGLYQAVTLPFVGEPDLEALGRGEAIRSLLRVKNPLRDEEGRLRPTMLPNLLNALRYNVSHGARSVALFEVGAVFHAVPGDLDPRLPSQPRRLAWAVWGDFGPRVLGGAALGAGAEVSLAIARLLLDALGWRDGSIRRGQEPGFHPGRTGEVLIGGVGAGHVGELSPDVAAYFELPGRIAAGELDLELLVAPVEDHLALAPSVFPPVDFDLSFVISVDVPVSHLTAATGGAGGSLVEEARVFDEFRGGDLGEDHRAVAIRYRLRAGDRTLTNEEVAPIREAMIEAASGLGARLRGL